MCRKSALFFRVLKVNPLSGNTVIACHCDESIKFAWCLIIGLSLYEIVHQGGKLSILSSGVLQSKPPCCFYITPGWPSIILPVKWAKTPNSQRISWWCIANTFLPVVSDNAFLSVIPVSSPESSYCFVNNFTTWWGRDDYICEMVFSEWDQTLGKWQHWIQPV